MSLLDDAAKIVELGRKLEQQRNAPIPPCDLCKPNHPCWVHRKPGNQTTAEPQKVAA